MQEIYSQGEQGKAPVMGQQSYNKFAEVSKLVASLQKHLSQGIPKQGRPGSSSFQGSVQENQHPQMSSSKKGVHSQSPHHQNSISHQQ
jgi:hypothetical protein